jgi:hypothetical protein
MRRYTASGTVPRMNSEIAHQQLRDCYHATGCQTRHNEARQWAPMPFYEVLHLTHSSLVRVSQAKALVDGC